jgi:hypothetical protein
VMLDVRVDAGDRLSELIVRATDSLCDAVAHRATPAPLGADGELVPLASGQVLPAIRLYMFSSRPGLVLAGVRRRRFRLHGEGRAPLVVSCVAAPHGGQNVLITSGTAGPELVNRLAQALRAELVRHPDASRLVEPAHMPIGACA